MSLAGIGLVAFVVLPWWAKPVGTVLLGMGGARLFAVGHEALHRCFTASRRLDGVIAMLAMLPTLHPLGPVTHGHVKLHHRFTNLKGLDPQWCPLSVADYRARSAWGRLGYRVYRSLPGLGLYWTIEIVVKNLLLPGRMPLVSSRDRRVFARDRAIVGLYVVALVLGWRELAPWCGLDWGAALVGGLVLPLMIAHWFIGLLTLTQHTSGAIAWYDDPERWSFWSAQVAGTLRIEPGAGVAWLLDDPRPHGAHHVDMCIPAHHLAAAQQLLERAYPGAVPVESVGLAELLRRIARCKLYDYRQQRWLDVRGRPTSPALRPAPGGDPGRCTA